MSKKEMIHIGTSGWHYDHWRGPFYPEDLPQQDFFQVRTVEISNSFYQLPKRKTLEAWRKTVPPGFIFVTL
jgi:uncharacterized protein YecE (DUF72 family)